MIDKLKYTFCGLLLLLSCENNENEAVIDVSKASISEEKMQLIMRDICLIEGRVKRKYSLNGLSTDSTTKVLYGEVFDKYGVTQEQFVETYDIYANNPKELTKIMNEVVNDLKSGLDTIPKPEKNN